MSRKSRVIEFNIDRVDFPNKGIGTFEDRNIRIKGGIPGQKVKAKVAKRRKEYWEAKLIEVLEKSPLETEEGCPHKDVCGGCTYQSLTYENEKNLKLKQVQALFDKEGLGVKIEGIEESPDLVGYRNKMEYTFGDEEKDGPLALGLHMKGRFYEVVNTDHCNIVNKDFTIIRETVRSHFDNLGLPFYNKRAHEGLLRHLVIRRAGSTGEILVNLVTSSQIEIDRESFVKALLSLSDLEGKITGILHTINDGLGDTVTADKLDTLYGTDIIHEEILGLKFKISPFSFFQTNTSGAKKLYSIAREFAGEKEGRIIFDLYSGTGTIAQMMAAVAKNVIGIEIVEEAVDMARENAKHNSLDNVEFIADDVFKGVEELTEKPDLIIIDPPRDGIHPKSIDKIIDFGPEEYVYISCNPVTLVRDLKIFKDRGYEIKRVKLMDMFPRTPHVETVCLIERK
ncbi:23S rRNA (uracil(1939)-C(5))-methyltransferase RlmD [Gudongella sp. DL1XJH-153]|uniref:23S rRNA (uracil(1939)-C(5))-methyltransferase RlmD n=1 Tax=Gudongella sp. DL1XJH-153 TaxID=3409804 RepID=UPI003BB52692